MKFIIGGAEGKKREAAEKRLTEFNKYNFPISTSRIAKERKVQGLYILLLKELNHIQKIVQVSTREAQRGSVRGSQDSNVRGKKM